MKTALLLATLLSAGCSCTTVRQLRPAETVRADAPTERKRTDAALDYSVAKTIKAPPDRVWRVLTDAAQYPRWNSTIVKLDGTIAAGQKLALVSKDAPDKTFNLAVTTFDANQAMVWEDGGSMFLGVRTFTLLPAGDGATTFVMSETFSGGMLGMIEGSLPDFTKTFDTFAADLKTASEAGGA
jgi:uncharacterized protein YndB with AHSA1/START domain